jgi:hypothetical protein
MSRVFCITEPIKIESGEPVPLFDLTPAYHYGDVEILLQSKQTGLNTTPIIQLLREKLQDFCDDDYILPVGDPTIIGIVSALVSDINQGRFKILKWEKRQRIYIPIQVDIYG